MTNGYIRKKFGVDEGMAQEMYDYLKLIGIVGTMGCVLKDDEESEEKTNGKRL